MRFECGRVTFVLQISIFGRLSGWRSGLKPLTFEDGEGLAVLAEGASGMAVNGGHETDASFSGSIGAGDEDIGIGVDEFAIDVGLATGDGHFNGAGFNEGETAMAPLGDDDIVDHLFLDGVGGLQGLAEVVAKLMEGGFVFGGEDDALGGEAVGDLLSAVHGRARGGGSDDHLARA